MAASCRVADVQNVIQTHDCSILFLSQRKIMATVIIRLFAAGFLLFLSGRIYESVASGAGDYEAATRAQTARADGTVTAVLAGHFSRSGDTVTQTVAVSFAASSGEQFSFAPDLIGSHARVGMKVRVRYDPDDPQSSSLVPDVEPARYFDLFYLVSAILAAAGIANLWALRHRFVRIWNAR
jgi:hypothetical protein